MKVAISYPPIPTSKGVPLLSQNRQFQYFNAPTFIYPMIPAAAATLLHAKGHDVIWDDAVSEQKDYKKWLRQMSKRNLDLIAIETKTPTVKWYWKVIDDIKEISPETTAVIYGDHVTAMPEESLHNSNVDYVLTGGDYDLLINNLVEYLEGKSQLGSGVYWRENGGIKNTGKFETKFIDLNALPMIDRELTKWKLYSVYNGNYKVTPGTYTMFGRDCWYRAGGGCTFCSWTTTYPTFKCVSPERALDEVEHIASLGIREIFDDTGTFPVGPWLKKFCEGMIERGLNKELYMGCNMRFGVLSQEEYNLMKKANFRFVLYGLESANQKSINMLNKGVNSQQQVVSCRKASIAGLDPHLTVMFGYPWETRQDAMNTVKMVRLMMRKAYAKTLQATIMIPYPGTSLFRQAKENGWLLTEDWDRYDMREPVLKTPYMKREEVMQCVQALYNVAFHPQLIYRKLTSIRNTDDLRFIMRAAKGVFGHLKDFNPKQLAI